MEVSLKKVLTIDEIESQMKKAIRDDYRISYTMDQLRFPFGFKRMNGEELLMRTTLQGIATDSYTFSK